MDAFGHINNARYLTYFEEARIKYVDDILDWNYGPSKTGIIMGRAEIDFKLPSKFKDEIIIYTRCSHLGNKSFTLEYKMVKMESQAEILLATAKTVIVMYDYDNSCSIPVPGKWRNALIQFEGSSLAIK